ncbi:MAG: hypothetical protein K2N60_10135 [Oscillospiraceae bacterium]|nr:hypothetical protein [Oscillospiraceae bacterium]
MKLKKFLAAAVASAVVAAGAASVSALNDGEATYCFDTNAAMADWQTYGSVTETGTKADQTTSVSKNGNGSLIVSVNVADEVENQFGGFYVEASALGLKSFQGCTVEMSVLLCENAEGFYDNFSLFSDGMIWITAKPETLSTSEWTTVTLELPANADNSRVGFTIPTFTLHKGDILYIDDFSVTDSDGKIIANKGDYAVKAITSAESVSSGTNIVLTILLVVLILVIVGGIGIIVSSAIKRFS